MTPTTQPSTTTTRVGSPSTTLAAPPDTAPAVRRSVRQRAPALNLTAYQLKQEVILQQADGYKVRGFVHDWVVTSGDKVISVCSPAQFEEMFEDTGGSSLILSETDRATLTQMLGFGSTDSSQTLTRAVLRLARLSIGDIPVTFTTLQWEELARRAEKRGQKIGYYMQRLVEKLCQDLWTSLE